MSKIATGLFTFAAIAFAFSFIFHQQDVWLAAGAVGTGALAVLGWLDGRRSV